MYLSFLGLVNFYGKFGLNLASKLQPLYVLLNHSSSWKWTELCEAAFNKAKEILSSDQVLVHFDPSKPLVLSVDATLMELGLF